VTAPVLVIGGTGTTGSRVAIALRARDFPARVASRRVAPGRVRFDWADPRTHSPALDGVRGVYLVAPVGVADPAPLVAPFLDVAREHGVRRVVLLSSSAVPEGAPGLGELHRMVREGVPEPTVLRPSWFMQNLLGDHPHARSARTDGEIVTATGSGRVGFVDAGDIAAVAVHALVDGVPRTGEYLLTGPEALGYDDVAGVLSEITGRPVRHRSASVAELTARLVAAGYPPDFSAMLAALDADIARGTEDRITSAVQDVTGRPPRSFREVVAEAHLRTGTAS
jgi:uncharacterized protein YbjT (DUF2867 family)